jgi:hypothetical protein
MTWAALEQVPRDLLSSGARFSCTFWLIVAREKPGRMNDHTQGLAAQSVSAPVLYPSDIPSEWLPWFEELTGPDSADGWGLRAAIAITRYRKANGRGPTFAELFDQLTAAQTYRVAEPSEPQQLSKHALYGFRHHVAVHWRRLGWINWNKGTRSLQVGRTFHTASRAWTASIREKRMASFEAQSSNRLLPSDGGTSSWRATTGG